MNTADRLTAARAAGVAMGSIHRGAHVGWTTDQDVAAQLAGVDGIEVTKCRGGAEIAFATAERQAEIDAEPEDEE